MSGLLRGLALATALVLPTAAVAQLQVNQNFVTQGPFPSVGPTFTVQSADEPPKGGVAGAVGPVVADPVDPNTLYAGTPAGGIWKTTNGGATWTPLTDKQATLSISSLAFDPTNSNTLIAGTGLTANGTVCSTGQCFFTGSGGLRNGLLYSQDGGSTWTSLGAAKLTDQTVTGVFARDNVLLAGTYEISGFATDRHVGALYRSTDRGATFDKISGTHGLPDGPISSIVSDPSNPNRLYAAVTAPDASAGGKASTALYVSTDTGANWSPVFGAAQSGNTIQGTTQTIIKAATGPGGSVAVAVIDYVPGTTGQVRGLFWSGNNGASWTSLTVPALSDGVMQGSVNSAIAIDPHNKNLVYVTGDGIASAPFTLPAFRIDVTNPTMPISITDLNTANGSTVHSDSRSIAFDASGRMIVTSDGTIYVRTNPQDNSGVWTRISGNLSAFESYSVGYDAVGKRLITAAQDNGVTIQSARNAPLWNAVMGADGINAFVNDVTLAGSGRSVFYANTQKLGFPARIIMNLQGQFVGPQTADWGFGAKVTCNGTDCSSAVVGVWDGSPWVNNRVDPTRMAFGGSHVYVTHDTLTGLQDPGVNTVDLTLTDIGFTASGFSFAKIAYGTRDNHDMLVAGADALWQSTTATPASLVEVTSYTASGGIAPTGIVLDPRSQMRYFVADNSNLFGTRDQGFTFSNLTAHLLPLNIFRPTAVEFISNNGVNALLVGGMNFVADAKSPIAVADSDAVGMLSNWRAFGTGLPNAQVSALSYNEAVDVLAVGTFGRGVFALYDVTSYFSQATVLRFGLADNDSAPDASFLTNGASASRALEKHGSGTLIIAGDATYTGGTTIIGGTLQLGNGGASGRILGDVVDNGTLAFNRSDKFTFGGTISGSGGVNQLGPGNTVLTANNPYTGPTSILGGTLTVNGSIASSAVSVNAGGTLAGTGTVGPTTVMGGGMLAPGNSPGTITIAGNLAFQSGAFYLVQANSSAASSSNVTGSATTGGSVVVLFAPGSSLTRSFDILHAAGGLGGTTFSSAATNIPSLAANLSYTSTDVILNLTATLGSLGGGLSGNQQNVAGAINNFFNNGGTLPPAFANLFGLTGSNLGSALSLLSGEAATGAQQGAFQLGSQFLNIMLDPFVDGRSGGGGNGPALGFAPEQRALPEEVAAAYANVLKAPAPYAPRWNVWGGAYGGANKTSGDPAVVGSHDLTARAAGFTAGLDYRVAADAIVGFALAGGGTDWSLAQGLGGGRSDAFQAGVYGATHAGPAYLAAALAYTQYWMSTDRFAVFGDHLTARFNAQSVGGRLEGGYRFAFPFVGVTPYAALQAQAFHTPGFSETDVTGGGFALNFNARNASDTRSELGARFDRALAVRSNAVLTLRSRLAWAHDWVSDPTLVPLFQTLPGASFIVNGATPAKNSALASAGAELRLANGVSLLAKFDGEFAAHSQTYAGTGVVRYAW